MFLFVLILYIQFVSLRTKMYFSCIDFVYSIYLGKCVALHYIILGLNWVNFHSFVHKQVHVVRFQ